MLNIALEYHKVINEITANKALNMRQYELDDEGWDIIKDLLRVLKVRYFFITYIYYHYVRCIKKAQSSFLKIL